MKKIIIIFIFPFLLISCGGVKFYDTHPCIIVAELTDSHSPAANYPIRIVYPYDHYGVFYIWNAPDPVESYLDDHGRIEIDIADFYRPQLVIGSTVFRLDGEIIKSGGLPSKFPYRKDNELYKVDRETYNALKLPLKKYPEVDVVIN
jgi:hypothetical protein